MLPTLADLIDLLRSDAKRVGDEKRRVRSMPKAMLFKGRPDDGLSATMLGERSPAFAIHGGWVGDERR